MLIRRARFATAALTVSAVLIAGTLSSRARADWTTINGEPIAASAAYEYGPATQSDGSGGAWIAWRVGSLSGQVRLTRVRKDGTAAPGWSLDGVPMRTDRPTTGFPTLLADGRDGVYISFSTTARSFGDSAFFFVQRFQGNGNVAPGWPDSGVRVGPPAVTSTDFVTDGHGGLFVVWEPFDRLILGQHLDARGRALWGAARVLATGDESPLGFKAVSDEQGGILLPFDRSGIVAPPRALRIDADGVIHEGWGPEGVELTNRSATELGSVVADGRGGGFFSLTTGLDDPGRSARDVYAQHVLADGSIDPAWGSAGIPIATAPGEQTAKGGVTDDDGGAIFFWADHRPGALGFDIWGQRVTADGEALWTPGGEQLVSLAGNETIVDVVPDGSSGAFFVWRDAFDFETDLWMLRIDENGEVAPGWPADGLRLTDTPGSSESSARIAYRAPFDPIVVWDVTPGLAAYDVYAERVPADGPGDAAETSAHESKKAKPTVLAASATAAVPFGVVLRGASLELSLPASGATRIDLFDLAGRRVAARDAGFLAAGKHVFEVSVPRSTSSGLYFLRVTQAGRSWTSRLLRLRH